MAENEIFEQGMETIRKHRLSLFDFVLTNAPDSLGGILLMQELQGRVDESKLAYDELQGTSDPEAFEETVRRVDQEIAAELHALNPFGFMQLSPLIDVLEIGPGGSDD